MELRQLVYFDAVARYGGFTRAAERLHVAQPAVSAQIARLESELGVQLLSRTTRRVSLTHAGELLWTHARRVLDEVDAARADLNELAEVVRGRVRIGDVEALDPFDLPGALAELHARYPGVELSLSTGRLEELLAGLDAGELDLAFGPLPDGLPERFARRHLFSEELVIVTAPGHRTARRGALDLAQLRDEPFVCLPPDTGLRAILDDAAAHAGFAPRVPFEATTLRRIRELAAHGLGVALLARSVAAEPGPPVAVHPVDPPVHRAIGLIHHTGRRLTPAANACHELLAGWTASGDAQAQAIRVGGRD
ncbi:MAG: LysR family transcriptional regulator [Solirubrobacteraceae bacterium]